MITAQDARDNEVLAKEQAIFNQMQHVQARIVNQSKATDSANNWVTYENLHIDNKVKLVAAGYKITMLTTSSTQNIFKILW